MGKRARTLRSGFTTGTAAAAAAKGAVLRLVLGRTPAAVEVELLTGARLRIPLHSCRLDPDGSAACTVVKDAGDDPDVTHGAEIGARVRLLPGSGVRISGGPGVGRVTKPGLDVPPGEPAINPGPRRMITAAVGEALHDHGRAQAVEIEVFVPAGEEIARRTLNARLGILGGISILGTTGIVRPLSHEAFTATIRAALSVAAAAGAARAVLTTGRRSERFAQALWPELPPEAFVQIGDYFENGLATAAALGLGRVTVAAFFGKAVKMAQGAAHTHAGRVELTLDATGRVDPGGDRRARPRRGGARLQHGARGLRSARGRPPGRHRGGRAAHARGRRALCRAGPGAARGDFRLRGPGRVRLGPRWRRPCLNTIDANGG